MTVPSAQEAVLGQLLVSPLTPYRSVQTSSSQRGSPNHCKRQPAAPAHSPCLPIFLFYFSWQSSTPLHLCLYKVCPHSNVRLQEARTLCLAPGCRTADSQRTLLEWQHGQPGHFALEPCWWHPQLSIFLQTLRASPSPDAPLNRTPPPGAMRFL